MGFIGAMEDGRPRVTLIAKADKADKAEKLAEPPELRGDGRLRPAPARVRPREEKEATVTVVRPSPRKTVPSNMVKTPQSGTAGTTGTAALAPSSVSPAKARMPAKRSAAASGLDANGSIPKRKGVSNALKVGVPAPRAPNKSPAVPTTVKSNGADADVVVTSAIVKPPAPPRAADAPPLSAALFNVGGQTFQVAAKLIRSKADTLPAKLLAKAADPTRPLHVPVDICPERFRILLDWYRYGEIWVPNTVATKAVLRDAARLDFPNEIVVNGVLRSLHQLDANQVGRSLLTGVINRWQGFQPFFANVLSQIDEHFKSVASQSAASVEAKDEEAACAEEAFDFPRFVVPLFSEEGWVSPNHICSASRARILALKLEELGYLCEFSDADLLVSLPLKLRCELQAAGGHEGVGEPPPQSEAKDGVGVGGLGVKNAYLAKTGA